MIVDRQFTHLGIGEHLTESDDAAAVIPQGGYQLGGSTPSARNTMAVSRLAQSGSRAAEGLVT
jgi:hypothetical protein